MSNTFQLKYPFELRFRGDELRLAVMLCILAGLPEDIEGSPVVLTQ